MRNDITQIEQTAAHWAVRVDSPLTIEERQALDAWLAHDSRHLGAFVRASAQWQDFDRLGSMIKGSMVKGSMVMNAELTRDRGAAAAVAPQQRFNRRSLIAALMAGVGVTGLGWSTLLPAGTLYSTGVGEIRRIALEDGSTLVLNTDSQVRVNFSTQLRELNLLQGEALFEVANDLAGRPFEVRANDWRLRAAGTVFNLRLRGTEVDVTVSEGAVDLQRIGAVDANASAQRITANEEFILDTTHQAVSIEKLEPRRIEQRLAWVRGMVAFSGEPLATAVAEINRHNRRKLVIDDAALAAQPVVGAFRATDIDGFAAAVAAALNAEAVVQDSSVHLRIRS